MHKEKCNYCGKEIDADCMSALENGSPACPECVEEEEKRKLNNSYTNDEVAIKEKKNAFAKIKLWVQSNKKKAIVLACAITLIIIAIVSVTVIIVGNSDNDSYSSSSQSSFEESLKSAAKARASAHYKLRYDSSSVSITVASVRKSGSNWRVAGKVHAKDAYGDSFSANWSITYDENMSVVDSEFNTPRKD